MIGDGAKKLVERGFAAHGRAAGPAELDEFLEDYEANAAVATVAYPGMEAALNALAARGHKMAVCTNKPEQPARTVLAALGLEQFFAVVCGGDGAYRKPDPRHLGQALAMLGEAACVMIGDHENDRAAARGMSMPFIFAAWGYGTAEGDAAAHHPSDLPELVAAFETSDIP
jgi:phosphoglycolate phosphatase